MDLKKKKKMFLAMYVMSKNMGNSEYGFLFNLVWLTN